MRLSRQWIVRIASGALLGAVLAPAVVWLIWGPVQGGSAAAGAVPFPVTPGMAEAFGSLPLAAAVQSLLGALFGAVVMVATLPFADEGRELALRSALHFVFTAASFSLLLGVCRWVTRPADILLWVFLLAVLYLLVWTGRWVGWYMEVVQLRSLLGLPPGPSPLKWRETLPCAPLVLLVCIPLPLLLAVIDRTLIPDVPVLSQFLYPYLFLPVSGFFSGLSLGRRHGFCPLCPLLWLLLAVPASLILNGGLELFPFLTGPLSALAGCAAGQFFRRRPAGRT